MKNEGQLDTYLLELTQRKLTSQLKLIAAWDSLSIETQIKILSSVEEVPDQIISKGLDSPNDYVRYLIASRFLYSDDEDLLGKIKNDKNIIVRFTHFPSQKIFVEEKNLEGKKIIALKPENFFSMSTEEQALYFSRLSVVDGEEIAKIIEWGFNNQIDPTHLGSLIEECAHNFKKDGEREYSDDGLEEFEYSENLKTLWRLIPKLDATLPARYLIRCLPSTACFVNDDFFEETIKLLPKKLVIYLFRRNDFQRSALRRKISSSNDGIFDEEIKAAAASKLEINESSPQEQKKQDVIKSCILASLFIIGLICSFLEIHNFITFSCIVIPTVFWVIVSIRHSLNDLIEEKIKNISNALV